MSRPKGFQCVLVLGLAILAVQLAGCPDGAGTGNGNVNVNANDNDNGNANVNDNDNDNGNANVNTNDNGNANVNMNDNVNDNGGVPAGRSDDAWVTPPGSSTDYSGFSDTPIPAGFFGPTAEPFSGVIVFQGAPLRTDSNGS